MARTGPKRVLGEAQYAEIWRLHCTGKRPAAIAAATGIRAERVWHALSVMRTGKAPVPAAVAHLSPEAQVRRRIEVAEAERALVWRLHCEGATFGTIAGALARAGFGTPRATQVQSMVRRLREGRLVVPDSVAHLVAPARPTRVHRRRGAAPVAPDAAAAAKPARRGPTRADRRHGAALAAEAERMRRDAEPVA